MLFGGSEARADPRGASVSRTIAEICHNFLVGRRGASMPFTRTLRALRLKFPESGANAMRRALYRFSSSIAATICPKVTLGVVPRKCCKLPTLVVGSASACAQKFSDQSPFGLGLRSLNIQMLRKVPQLWQRISPDAWRSGKAVSAQGGRKDSHRHLARQIQTLSERVRRRPILRFRRRVFGKTLMMCYIKEAERLQQKEKLR